MKQATFPSNVLPQEYLYNSVMGTEASDTTKKGSRKYRVYPIDFATEQGTPFVAKISGETSLTINARTTCFRVLNPLPFASGESEGMIGLS